MQTERSDRSKLLYLVDIQEQYGRHIIDKFASMISGRKNCV